MTMLLLLGGVVLLLALAIQAIREDGRERPARPLPMKARRVSRRGR